MGWRSDFDGIGFNGREGARSGGCSRPHRFIPRITEIRFGPVVAHKFLTVTSLRPNAGHVINHERSANPTSFGGLEQFSRLAGSRSASGRFSTPGSVRLEPFHRPLPTSHPREARHHTSTGAGPR